MPKSNANLAVFINNVKGKLTGKKARLCNPEKI